MQVSENISLKPYNTFGIDVKASKFARFKSGDELITILTDPVLSSLPRMILGGGSNILLTADFEGLVLKNEVSGIHLIKEDKDFFYVRAGAGENWHEFVLDCIAHGRAGLENLSLIPGNVGASPMQNIGAYGVEVKDRFHELEALNLDDLETEVFDAARCEFGYRESIFKRRYKEKYVILSVTFKLFKKPQINTSYGSVQAKLAEMGIIEPTIEDVSKAVIEIRQSKLPDPSVIGNAGSFFKNPVVDEAHYLSLMGRYQGMPHYPAPEGGRKIAAGWLIEKAGWKGYRDGNYGVHANQALVLVNHGGASGNEIFELSESIMKDVYEKFGIQLEREVNVV